MKKIFISYSWGNSEYQKWVKDLATRLMDDTVDVMLDQWSLKDGQDIYSFMEEMVKSEDIFRVLILSNKKYTEKANGREGGVGTETQIITPNIYSKEKQEKFIPIVLERNEDGEAYLPIYLKSRKYIDFSKEENFEDSYEELLRNILESPSIPKPKLGVKPPSYITNNSINLSVTNNRLRTIESQIKKNGSVSQKELSHFIEIFLEKLWEFEMINSPNDLKGYGEALINTLKLYKPLREDFIKFVDIVTSNSIDNSIIFIEYFENEPIYQSPKDGSSSYNSSRFEIFKIIFHELYIYTIAVGLRNKNFELVADLLHSKYYTKEKYKGNQFPKSFTFLDAHHRNFENYYEQHLKRRIGFGDYLTNNLSENLKKEDILLADVICYIVSTLEDNSDSRNWFPLTYFLKEEHAIYFLDKMTSERHFEQVKSIFNVKNKEELIAKIKASEIINKGKQKYSFGPFLSLPFVHELINHETISIYR
jgi:TIR domain